MSSGAGLGRPASRAHHKIPILRPSPGRTILPYRPAHSFARTHATQLQPKSKSIARLTPPPNLQLLGPGGPFKGHRPQVAIVHIGKIPIFGFRLN